MLLCFPPGCHRGIEYSSVLVVGQPEVPGAWLRRRLEGSVPAYDGSVSLNVMFCGRMREKGPWLLLLPS
jgi:hypothetical protein